MRPKSAAAVWRGGWAALAMLVCCASLPPECSELIEDEAETLRCSAERPRSLIQHENRRHLVVHAHEDSPPVTSPPPEAIVPPWNETRPGRWMLRAKRRLMRALGVDEATAPRAAKSTPSTAPEHLAFVAVWARQSKQRVGSALEEVSKRTGVRTSFVAGGAVVVVVIVLICVACCLLMVPGLARTRPSPHPSTPGHTRQRLSLMRRSRPPDSQVLPRKTVESRTSRTDGTPTQASLPNNVVQQGSPSSPALFTTPRTAPAKSQHELLEELRANPLCPSLMVPAGCECTLLMPKLKAGFFSEGRQMPISDPKGNPVMRVAFLGARGRGAASVQGTPRADPTPRASPRTSAFSGSRLVLSDMANEVLALCQEDKGRSGPGGQVIAIHSPQGMFAQLRPVAEGYEVIGLRSWRLNLVRRMLPGGSGLAALDESGTLLAVCEPCDEDLDPERTVRIDANVDAGLIVLCILCTDVLEVAF